MLFTNSPSKDGLRQDKDLVGNICKQGFFLHKDTRGQNDNFALADTEKWNSNR